MNKTVKRKWVKALRSGKFKQGANRLVWNDQYCCLGVLCEILGGKKVEGTDRTFSSFPREQGFLIDGYFCAGSLPQQTADRIKLSVRACRKLAELNDKRIMSFKDIADHVERYY